MPAFEPWIYHYPTVWPWEKYLTSLALNFLIFEVELIISTYLTGLMRCHYFFNLWLSNIALYICTPVKPLCPVLGTQQMLHMGWLQPGSIWPDLSADTPSADWLFPSVRCLISQGTTHCPVLFCFSLPHWPLHSLLLYPNFSSPHSLLRWAHSFPWLQCYIYVCHSQMFMSIPNLPDLQPHLTKDLLYIFT